MQRLAVKCLDADQVRAIFSFMAKPVEPGTRKPLAPAAERALAEAAARRGERDKVAQQRPKESGGPKGPEPTRYGDWEKNGIASDF
jgi:hypothetical protein